MIDMRAELCKRCIHTKVCCHDKNLVGDNFVSGNPMIFDNQKLYEEYKEREKVGFPCGDFFPVVVLCKDCVYAVPYNEKWYQPKIDDYWCNLYGRKEENHYCADGERR
jgi:hypothetical protein